MVSIHAPRAGRDVSALEILPVWSSFQSTRPARGATGKYLKLELVVLVSIHAPRAGRDVQTVGSGFIRDRFNPRAPRGARPFHFHAPESLDAFQSTRPARGATVSVFTFIFCGLFQSTRPARGATDCLHGCGFVLMVSIHAPRAGRDLGRIRNYRPRNVSIHAPRAGRDTPRTGARLGRTSFNPRAPRGARPSPRNFPLRHRSFNPRAPRGARHNKYKLIRRHLVFQSTRPARGATAATGDAVSPTWVSIHAPRAGRDRNT